MNFYYIQVELGVTSQKNLTLIVYHLKWIVYESR